MSFLPFFRLTVASKILLGLSEAFLPLTITSNIPLSSDAVPFTKRLASVTVIPSSLPTERSLLSSRPLDD